MFGWLRRQVWDPLCVCVFVSPIVQIHFLLIWWWSNAVNQFSVSDYNILGRQGCLASCIEGETPGVCVPTCPCVHSWKGSSSSFPDSRKCTTGWSLNLLFFCQTDILYLIFQRSYHRNFKVVKHSGKQRGFTAFSDHCLMTGPSCTTPRPHCKVAVIL